MQTQTSTFARIRFLAAEKVAAAAECAAREALNVLEELRFGEHLVAVDEVVRVRALASAVATEEEARTKAAKAWEDAHELEDGATEEAFTEFAFSTYARYDRRGWSPQAAMDCVARAGECGFGPGLVEIRASRARLSVEHAAERAPAGGFPAADFMSGEGDGELVSVDVVEMEIDGVTYLYDEAGEYAGIPHLLLTQSGDPIGIYDVQSGEIIYQDFEVAEEEEVRQQPQR